MTATAPRLPRPYWRLWTASAVSNLGDGMYLVAIPLIAARITDSAVGVALVAAFASLPWMLLSIPIGALVDRRDRRSIMVRANVFRAAVVGALAVVVATDQVELWMLWLAALALGVGEVFFDNATVALVPGLVPEEQLPRANGRLYAAELGANGFIGTPLGGVLFAVAAYLPLVVDAWSFAFAALLLMSLNRDRRVDAPSELLPSTPTTRLRDDIRVGWRFLWDHPILRPLATAFAIVMFAFQMPLAVLVLFVRDTLGLGPRGYAAFLTIITIGPVIGGLIGDRVVYRLGRSRSMFLALGTWIVCLGLTAAYPHVGFVIVAATVQAVATTVWNITTVSLRQVVVPNELFGRVNSIYRWCGWGMMSIGALAGGLVASRFGMRAPYVAAACVIGLAVVVLARGIDREVVDDATASMHRPQVDQGAS
jgi:MFS family permease